MDFNVDFIKYLISAVAGAGTVLMGGAFWLGSVLTTGTGAIANLNRSVSEMTVAIQNIAKEFEKRDERIEALGRRHDEVRERVVILEHTQKSN